MTLQSPEALPLSAPPVRLVLPLPPLTHLSSNDLCQAQGASCWGLAPWHGRTLESPASSLNAKQQMSPPWVFASLPARPVLAPGTSASWNPAPVRAGCWGFSPSTVCARSRDRQP
ncbi:hypothetical protein [Streptosporangium sp. NPDC087985]|uniref:hypothetical protein n=1 Tax=Streptosporangium sp. NPDC087985 TaxID=3366196 RepID=UPI0038053F2B